MAPRLIILNGPNLNPRTSEAAQLGRNHVCCHRGQLTGTREVSWRVTRIPADQGRLGPVRSKLA
jgi:hypothetical protein